MKYTLYITSSALSDIRSAHGWYVSKGEAIALRFDDAVRNALDAISVNPLVFQERYTEVRVSLLSHYPYGVFFTIVQHKIVILAVIHTSRSPRRWPSP